MKAKAIRIYAGVLQVGQGERRTLNNVTVIAPYGNPSNGVDLSFAADQKNVLVSLSREDAWSLVARIADELDGTRR